MHRLIWALIILPGISFSQLSRIRLEEPSDYSTYAIRSAGDTTSVTVKYEIYSHIDLPITSVQLCVQVTTPETNEVLLPSTCFTVNEGRGSKIIDGLSRGSYALTLTLHDDTSTADLDTRAAVITRFYVEEVQYLLPKLSISNPTVSSGQGIIKSEISVVASASTDSSLTDVTVEYSLGNSMLNMNEYEVCVHLVEKRTNVEVLQLSCLSTSQKQFTVQELSRGSYTLSLTLADRAKSDTVNSRLFPSTQITSDIYVSSITESMMMPYIALTSELTEVGLHSSDHTSDVTVEYVIEGLDSAVRQVQVCAEVDMLSEKKDTKLAVPLTCVNSGQPYFLLKGLGAGIYNVRMLLRLLNTPHTLYTAAERNIKIELREFTEIVPSYNWQPLHAWHSIPGGIQTRLPLSSGARKEAKIPEPWQLQLSMPSPCKYFLRMSVDRSTTVSQILNAAGKQCKMDPSSFVLTADGAEILDIQETMESTDFFNSKHGLIIVANQVE